MDLDAGDIARQHVPDPPGFDSSSGREVVRASHGYHASQTSAIFRLSDANIVAKWIAESHSWYIDAFTKS